MGFYLTDVGERVGLENRMTRARRGMRNPDTWNLIRETTVNREPGTSSTNLYVWGLDLSGSLQGAGGIGGLLATVRPDPTNSLQSTAYLPCFDANGNVSEFTSIP